MLQNDIKFQLLWSIAQYRPQRLARSGCNKQNPLHKAQVCLCVSLSLVYFNFF